MKKAGKERKPKGRVQKLQAQKLPSELRRAFRAAANPETKKSYEAYMRYQEEYLGLKAPAVVAISKEIVAPYSAEELDGVWQRLIRSRYAEEKFAGIVIYQMKILKNSDKSWRKDLRSIASLVNGNHVFWWATCDGLAGRVVGKIIAKHKEPAVREVIKWRTAKNLWLRRLSIVSFVGHARKGDALFKGALQMILETAAVVVKSEERFHQTGVGWVIREVYKGKPKVAERFIDEHHRHFSREGLRYAIEKMPEKKRKKYLTRRS